MPLHDRSGDPEADAESRLFLIGRARLAEPLEDDRQIVFGDAHASIRHRHDRLVILAVR